jgi:hypothetical protein
MPETKPKPKPRKLNVTEKMWKLRRQLERFPYAHRKLTKNPVNLVSLFDLDNHGKDEAKWDEYERNSDFGKKALRSINNDMKILLK